MHSVGIAVSNPPAVWLRWSASRIVSSSGETDATAGLRFSAARNSAAARTDGATAQRSRPRRLWDRAECQAAGAAGPSGVPAGAVPAARPPTRAITRC